MTLHSLLLSYQDREFRKCASKAFMKLENRFPLFMVRHEIRDFTRISHLVRSIYQDWHFSWWFWVMIHKNSIDWPKPIRISVSFEIVQKKAFLNEIRGESKLTTLARRIGWAKTQFKIEFLISPFNGINVVPTKTLDMDNLFFTILLQLITIGFKSITVKSTI